MAGLNAAREPARPPILFLLAAPEGTSVPQRDQVDGASVIRLSADDSDVRRIERDLRSLQQAALAEDERLQWRDRGAMAGLARRPYYPALVPKRVDNAVERSCAGRLPRYRARRRPCGWMAGLVLTPDQQGWMAYQDNRFAEAGELFEDPMWRGYAKYRAGAYEEAITIFQGLETAGAAFAQGMAEIKSRQYRPAVRSFETALERRPDFPEAERNRAIAIAIVEFVETAQEQSYTGEDRGIGADEIVFDNEAARGTETQVEAPKDDVSGTLTVDQWVDVIDTHMSDVLRSRCPLENSQGSE